LSARSSLRLSLVRTALRACQLFGLFALWSLALAGRGVRWIAGWNWPQGEPIPNSYSGLQKYRYFTKGAVSLQQEQKLTADG
jgi:hypothetical protein